MPAESDSPDHEGDSPASPVLADEMPRKRMSLTLTYRVSLLVSLLLLASAVITTAFSLKSVESTVFFLSSQSVNNIHEAVAALITVEYDNITDYRTTALAQRKEQLRDVGKAAKGAFDALNQQVVDGTMTQDEAQQAALNIVRTIRFGPKDTDYLFAYNRDLVAIGHPDPKFQGKNMSDMQDPDGVYVLREIRDQALNFGEGFVPYKWVRLGEETPKPKISYVFHYEPWDWIVGTGVYIDDIEATVQSHLDQQTQYLSQTFTHVEFGDGGFPFILNSSGEPLIKPEGADMSWLATPEGRVTAREIQAEALAGKGQIVTRTMEADFDGTGMQEWVVSTSAFAPMKWTIATAIPYAELARPGRILAFQQGILSLIVLVVGVVGGLLISRRIVRPVAQVTEAAQALGRDEFVPATLDKAAARHDEIGELARVFRRMASEIVERERALRERVAKLTIQIDREKVDSAVDEIVDTDYFARLKSQADAMRKQMKEHEGESDEGSS